jgi:hypothetical protein
LPCADLARLCLREDAAAPALFLNTTNVETGAQMVLSPTWLGQAYILGTGVIEDFHRKSAVIKDIPLSTAIGLSARFPWILPVGWYEFTIPPPLVTTEKPQNRRLTVVDGGYSEGSGAATAENLAQYLVKYAEFNPQAMRGLKIAPKIIMIGGSYEPVDQFYQTEAYRRSYDEATAPLEALLRAWGSLSTTVAIEAGLTGSGPTGQAGSSTTSKFRRSAGRSARRSANMDLLIGRPRTACAGRPAMFMTTSLRRAPSSAATTAWCGR